MPRLKNPTPKIKRRQAKIPFERGNLVTGVDRSYKRSIYKFISDTESSECGVFEFQTLANDSIMMYKMRGYTSSKMQKVRRYDEFRLAEPLEVLESNKLMARDSLRYLLKKLGVHIEI